jgi:hypothetical protein
MILIIRTRRHTETESGTQPLIDLPSGQNTFSFCLAPQNHSMFTCYDTGATLLIVVSIYAPIHSRDVSDAIDKVSTIPPPIIYSLLRCPTMDIHINRYLVVHFWYPLGIYTHIIGITY